MPSINYLKSGWACTWIEPMVVGYKIAHTMGVLGLGVCLKFNISIFNFCPISYLQKYVYQNMEQETIFRSSTVLHFPWRWRSWCTVKTCWPSGIVGGKFVSLAILLHVKCCSQFLYTDFYQRCLETDPNGDDNTVALALKLKFRHDTSRIVKAKKKHIHD